MVLNILAIYLSGVLFSGAFLMVTEQLFTKRMSKIRLKREVELIIKFSSLSWIFIILVISLNLLSVTTYLFDLIAEKIADILHKDEV